MTVLPVLRAALGAALLSLAVPAPARAQLDSREAIALQNQILELRRELDALRRGGGMAAPVPRGSGGGLGTEGVARLQEMEEEIRRLRGRNDVLENANRQLREDIEKLRGDMDFRLRALEGTGGAGQRPPQQGRPGAQPPAPPQASVSQPPPPPAPPPPPLAAPARPNAPWRKAGPPWPAATTRPPRPRRARSSLPAAAARAPMTRTSCWPMRWPGAATTSPPPSSMARPTA